MTLVKAVGGPAVRCTARSSCGWRAWCAAETRDAVAAALRAGVEGVGARPRRAGDKTMFDALAPAPDALDATLARAAVAGTRSADATAARVAMQQNPWSPGRAAPATSGSAASATWIRAPRPSLAAVRAAAATLGTDAGAPGGEGDLTEQWSASSSSPTARLAEGVADLVAPAHRPEVLVVAAGGGRPGSLGTDATRVLAAIEDVGRTTASWS